MANNSSLLFYKIYSEEKNMTEESKWDYDDAINMNKHYFLDNINQIIFCLV